MLENRQLKLDMKMYNNSCNSLTEEANDLADTVNGQARYINKRDTDQIKNSEEKSTVIVRKESKFCCKKVILLNQKHKTELDNMRVDHQLTIYFMADYFEN